ncbi:MAG: hypothetical protein AAGB29_14050 [Planctomycetota bacterium]
MKTLNGKLSLLALLAIVGFAMAGCSESASESHAHHHGEEVALEPATIGDMAVELAQGHGSITPGGVGHIVIKLPYSDNGATVVRAWVGGEDAAGSTVGQGIYAPSHDDYDVHTMAPDPLPADAMWWIEVIKPDGTTSLGSAKPITD